MAQDPNADSSSAPPDSFSQPDTVEVFQAENGEWTWHRKTPNGQIVSGAMETYKNKGWAMSQAARLNAGIDPVQVKQDGQEKA